MFGLAQQPVAVVLTILNDDFFDHALRGSIVNRCLDRGSNKTSGGRHPVSPWGKPEGRTRNRNKLSNKLIVRRRRTGKKHHR